MENDDDLPFAAAAAQPVPVAPPQQPAAVPQHPVHGGVRLAAFWPTSPEEWFTLADGQFYLHGVADERARFYLVLGALPEHVARSVADLLRGPLPDDAYQQLRRRLLAAHTLTEYHRLEQLHAAQGLGGQRPSEMFASMLQLAPADEQNSKFLRYLFLQRLPRELRIMLSEDGVTPLPQLAARADTLWSHNFGAGGHLAAVMEEELPVVAAVAGGNRTSHHRGRGRPGRGRGGGAGAGGNRPAAASQGGQQTMADVARAGTGLCHHHFTYGDRAHKCTPPCTWAGN
jgi:hypothetical protein